MVKTAAKKENNQGGRILAKQCGTGGKGKQRGKTIMGRGRGE